jgi:hypothetical protein
MRAWIAATLLGCNATLAFEQGTDTGIDAGADTAVVEETSTGCGQTGCPFETLHCDTATGECVECIADEDCPYQLPRCDKFTHRCFECLEAGDCLADRECVVAARRCVRSCTTKEECISPMAPTCDTFRGICIGCVSPASCPDPARRNCLLNTGQCVQCGTDKQCPFPDRPHCDNATWRCVACVTSEDCPAPKVCEPSRHVCMSP